MKRLFNRFMSRKDLRDKLMAWPSYARAQKGSSMFNAWLMDYLSHPTEFANKFMVRKWLEKLSD